MADPCPGSKKRGLFAEADQEPVLKQLRLSNPDYQRAFGVLDPTGSGSIGLLELRAGIQKELCWTTREFNPVTCCWLFARFGAGAERLNRLQFCELWDYLQNVMKIFNTVDCDETGDIDCAELHRAFTESKVEMPVETVTQIGRSYDIDGNGKLEFDEFVQMHMEWGSYADAWDSAVQGGVQITPSQLLGVLESIKTSLEPVGKLLQLASQGAIPAVSAHNLIYSGMFGTHSFSQETCLRLIIRFGAGNLFLLFEQFCLMMIFVKEVKANFCSLDKTGDGKLNLSELSIACARAAGRELPAGLVQQIGMHYDKNQSGFIDFDEFLQLTIEWQELWAMQAAADANLITAPQLQQMMPNVRVLYHVVDGQVATLTRFSLSTCRWLVAKFGTCQPGQRVPQSLTHENFLEMAQHLKARSAQFFQSFPTGSMPATQLPIVLAQFGLALDAEAMAAVCQSYSLDQSSSIEFDNFLHILIECQMYDLCFSARSQHPTILSPLNTVNPLTGAPLVAAAPGPDLITLDKSAFFSLIFAVPRDLAC